MALAHWPDPAGNMNSNAGQGILDQTRSGLRFHHEQQQRIPEIGHEHFSTKPDKSYITRTVSQPRSWICN